MVVIVFRARLRAGVDPRVMVEQGARMRALGSAQPGFVSYKEFGAEDGENVAIVEFETLEDSARWGENPEHRRVQEEAKASYFETFSVQVCTVARESRSPAKA